MKVVLLKLNDDQLETVRIYAVDLLKFCENLLGGYSVAPRLK
jgi:hypothetical protein